VQQAAGSFDYLVGADERIGWLSERAEESRSYEALGLG
jgi:hypothetical protein